LPFGRGDGRVTFKIGAILFSSYSHPPFSSNGRASSPNFNFFFF
jgi:hypothetical protein